ncbi:elongation factor P maturation arginine rhamnosyltransferase EarP [Alcaligenaceae bacterium]|nr:elongation factor P maturation arginine rhamnosyltransferase EarP [Alcaligenaceae bacterium]
MARLSFDIFCRVVDNFGDIGVCWRLARQLKALQPNSAVRLWVDDLYSFSRIAHEINAQAAQQSVHGIEIVHWTHLAPRLQPHSVVIEAFACDPPAAFIDAMVQQNSLWINLEYLSAENWVESCHMLPSAQANGLRKYFFFPGFTTATGGLLLEPDLLSRRDQWLSNTDRHNELLQAIGVPASHIQRLQQGARQVFLFCYASAPAQSLLDTLKQQASPSLLIVPSGVYPALLNQSDDLVYIHEMPFVGQDAFDHLLWSSDLNFVRGEDSLVRALWAGRPLVWQIYSQDADAHMIKLQAWLEQSPYAPGVQQLMRAWNVGNQAELSLHLHNALQTENWAAWQSDSNNWCTKLAENPDLAYSLLEFCTQQQRSG